MSKSRGNVVVPDVYIKKYGADALRTYLMFLGPFDMGGDFRDTGIAGMHKFLARVWRLVISYQSSAISKTNNTDNWELDKFMHKTIKAVTDDMENLRYNTAIAHIMEFVNELSDNRHLITDNHIKSLLLMLAPFAPHMTEELWQSTVNSQQITDNKKPTTHNLQHTTYNSIHLHPWPIHDPKMLVEDEVIVIAQVNGKVRDTIKVKRHNSQVKSEVEKLARDSESIKKYLENRPVRKVIFVPGKLINFVV
jgi:leucyl-tRNA synthetase